MNALSRRKMDLTEIMDFLNEINDASELNTAEEQNMSVHLESVGDLSPLQRSRANTWHGNRSIVKNEPISSSEKENRTTPVDSVSGEHCLQTSNKHLGIDHASSIICRKSISRRNAWGNFSYADMITKAINSSPEKRMTLSEIYNWMVQNIPFFKDKGDTNSSAGWKNSIRHNLSLHSCFMRVQNEGTGKSSWWMINPDYKASKLPRRRAVTMDNSKALSLHQRKSKATKKADSVGSSDGLTGAISKSRSSSSDLNFVEPKPEVSSSEDVFLPQDFRPRSSSNSIKALRLSPALEADDPPDHISWPVSEASDMEMQQEGYGENQEYFGKMFCTSGMRMQSPRSGINSPGSVSAMKTSERRTTQLPNSLTVPSNISQTWNYNEIDQAQYLNQEGNFKGIRASEHMLMSGGGLINAGHKHMMRNVPPQLWMSRSPNSTPLLRDYLSRDDYDAKQNSSGQTGRSEVSYHQKLYSGGGHSITPNSPNFSSTSINASPSWQQQQHPHSSHGLLLQLLTDSSQQQQQQIPERKNSPHQHPQTYSQSPTNQSMLQHLLTVRQKSHRQVLPGSGQHQYQQYLLSSHQHPSHQIQTPMEHQRVDSNQMPQHFFDVVSTSPMVHFQQQSTNALTQVLPQLHFSPHPQAQQQQQQFQSVLLPNDPEKSGELLNDLLTDSRFPTDLDFSLLELDSSADIECNIDQVIDHEKKFGELWDFNFDDDFLSENKNFHESIK